MSEIDWDNFPKATHYTPSSPGIYAAYWRKDGDKWAESWVIGRDGCIEHYIDSAGPTKRNTVIPRPSAPQWSGEGLPPIGIDCQMTHEGWGSRGWEQVKILYISAEYAITTDGHNEQHWHMRNVRFRPIRTPEQLAAERRAETIKRAAELCPFPRADSTFVILETLYDNGLLKGSDEV